MFGLALQQTPLTWTGSAPELGGVMWPSQTVEGNRLILEPLHDVDSLAGSLGTGRPKVSVEKMKRGASAAMTQAARKALQAN